MLVREDTMPSAVVHATKIGVGLLVLVFITAGWAVKTKLLVCVCITEHLINSHTPPFASNEEYTTSKMWDW